MNTIPKNFFHEPSDLYHSKTAKQFMSSHLLGEAHESLDKWRERMTVKRSDSPVFALGRAVHTLVLEGQEAFDEEFLVGGAKEQQIL